MGDGRPCLGVSDERSRLGRFFLVIDAVGAGGLATGFSRAAMFRSRISISPRVALTLLRCQMRVTARSARTMAVDFQMLGILFISVSIFDLDPFSGRGRPPV